MRPWSWSWAWLWPRLALVAAFVLLCACAGREQRAERRRTKRADLPPGPVVRAVELEGVEYFTDDELIEYLNLKPTPAITFGARNYYVPGLETIDARRIVEVYAAHGHYEARVVDIEVEVETRGNERRHARRVERRARRGKPPPRPRKQIARAHIVVEEGPATTVRNRKFAWSPAEAGVPPPEHAEVEGTATLDTDEVFNIPDLQDSAREMERNLRRAGYAHARVEERAEVDTEARWADIEFTIAPGRPVTIGTLRIEGLALVPEDLVLREVDFAEGKPFSPRLVEEIERRVYAMEVFSAVSISEGPPKDDGTIDLEIAVQESKLQSFKVGGGIGIDPVRWEQRAIFRYRHDSIFGRLTRMDVAVKAGYAELPALYDPQQHGPIAALELDFRKKGLLEKHLVWTERPSIELGIWDGYQFWTIRNRIGVSRFFTRYFEAGLGYNNRFTDFFNVSPALDENQTLLGADFRDPYFLSYFSLQTTVHLVDDMLAPKNGMRFKTGYDLANRFVGSQFNFHRVPVELQLYYRPHGRIQLTGRAKVGIVIPYGDPAFAGIPIDEKWYLGGAYDVRGWPLRQLSPRAEGNCNAEGEKCDQIPIGGNSMVLFNVEPRVRLVSELWLGTFLDVGDVRPEALDFVPAGWQASTGGGLRYESPIGTIRLDFGWRLTRDDARFPVEQRFLPNDDNYAIHLAIGEVF